MKQIKNDSPENCFLKYAFPCANTLLCNNQITKKEFKELQKDVLEGKTVHRERLLKLFPAAFRRISEVADKINKCVWDSEVIRHYFIDEHNEYIDRGEGNYKNFPKTFRNFCKVYKAEIVKKEGRFLSVKYNSMKREVLADLVPEAEKGDVVTIHQGYAVEKIE